MTKKTVNNIVIRVSKENKGLILVSNCEKVYRVYLNGDEKLNTIKYDEASDFFNRLNNQFAEGEYND